MDNSLWTTQLVDHVSLVDSWFQNHVEDFSEQLGIKMMTHEPREFPYSDSRLSVIPNRYEYEEW